MTRSLKKGVDVYETWHAKEPSQLKKIKVSMPETVRSIGVAEMIAYRSGKWQKGNSTEDYEHDFTSRPTIYHEGGDGSSREVSGMLKNDVIVDLGFCIELNYLNLDGEECEIPIGRSRSSRMVCTSDMKTLIILHKSGPIFIKGGKMKVTARGIVK